MFVKYKVGIHTYHILSSRYAQRVLLRGCISEYGGILIFYKKRYFQIGSIHERFLSVEAVVNYIQEIILQRRKQVP